jgi:deoxyribose-phosphate aldolase
MKILKITSSADLAKVIDHSILKPELTEKDVHREIETAIKWNVASVCVMPCYLPFTVGRLKGTSIYPSTVAGFPLGYGGLVEKLFCVRSAIHAGAREIDYVINISNVRSEKWKEVEHEIESATYDCHKHDVKIKIIFENCYLTDSQKIRLTQICSSFNVDWVKTSTGFGTSGATLFDIELMVKYATGITQVKAAGGVRTFDVMMALVNAGISRCGCTATEAVLQEARKHYGS